MCAPLDLRGLALNLDSSSRGQDVSMAIDHCADDMTAITTVGCKLVDDDMCAVGEALRNVPSLSTVDFSSNLLSCDGVLLLCAALEDCEHLTDLDISFNDCHDSDACLAVARLLQRNSVTVVRMKACNIVDAGCADLAIALSDHNSVIRTLVLSDNRFSHKGAAIICRALRYNLCIRNVLVGYPRMVRVI
eukprot:EC799022.1.p1 GENE.EC799022.1~~EC799022.1.p1  ORF type:complete len:190 (+),score=36.32 EC799022.1:86-655(+)